MEIMEKKMETTTIFIGDSMGIMEKKMETTETTTILGLFNDRASALCCFFGADFSFGEPHAPAKSRLRFGHFLDPPM